jgi:mannose-6-phosphate isomerase
MSLSSVGLLHFQERYYERIWGGERLRTLYGRDAPADKPIGEAWLVSDHPGDESVVDEGPCKGKTLHDLIEEDSAAILGSRAALTIHGTFPLLLKVLDSADALSVQAHPDDDCAKRLGEPDVGKTEMWHVLHADPGSKLICGLDTSVTADTFGAAMQDGSLESMMTQFPVSEGISVFVAAGTVHAIGGGIVLAEIQQNSDLTYRIYDWGRVQADGTSRELHVEKALQSIHFGSPHGGEANGLSYELSGATCTVLAACRYFSAELIESTGKFGRETRGESFHILLAKGDGLTVSAGNDTRRLKTAEAVLIPGAQDEFTVEGEGAFLDYYVPDLEKDIVAPLEAHGHTREAIVLLGGDPGHSDLR